MEATLSIIFQIAGIYLALGALFSLVFIWKGLLKVDPETKGTNGFFKALIFPGLVVFWVYFLRKWLKA